MCQVLLKFLKPRNRFSKGLAAFRSCDEDAAKIFRLVSPFPLEQKRDIVKMEFSDNRRVEEKLPALLFSFHALWLTLSARVLSNAFSSTFMCYIMDFEPTSVIFFQQVNYTFRSFDWYMWVAWTFWPKTVTRYRFSARRLCFKILAYDNPCLIGPMMGDMRDEGDPTLFLFSTFLVFVMHPSLIVVN